MPALIHLNGPPAVGKSTLARRWADEHPGTLLCDVDALRTMIGGWESSQEAAELIRTAALGMVEAYLRTGHDVVLPQTVGRRDQLDRFRDAASAAGATYVGVMLTIDPAAAVRRFQERDADAEPDDTWARHVRRLWAANDGDAELLRAAATLYRLAAQDDTIRQVASSDVDATYQALVAAIGPDV